MNGKERVLKTIAHEEPDRVPIGEAGVDHDHIAKILGRETFIRNRKATTIALWQNRRDEVVETMKSDYKELVEKLDYDLLSVELVASKDHFCDDEPKEISDGVWEDKKGNIYKYASSNDSIMKMTASPENEEISEEDINKEAKLDESKFELLDYVGKTFGDEKAVLMRNVDSYGILVNPFGGDYSHKLMMCAIEPDMVKEMYRYGLEYNRLHIERAKKSGAVIAMQCHDYAMNSGTIMSPNTLRDIFFPFMTMLNDEIIKNDMIPFFHCCGNTWDILPDFVKSGFKGYQSIQSTAGMYNQKVKDIYGRDLTLWAGIQCETLVEGSISDTVEEVERSLEILMPNGGFIFGSTNSVQFGAKTDNYLRALEIVRNKGVYR